MAFFLWMIFILQFLCLHFFQIDLRQFGVHPRVIDIPSIIGICTAHILHANTMHLAMNTLSIFLLGIFSFAYSNKLTWRAIYNAAACSSIFTWLCGSLFFVSPEQQALNPVHIGASGWIFGLLGFLLLNGIFRKGCLPFFLSLLILLLYGGMLSGMIPDSGSGISWEMHFGGFIGGAITSFQERNEKRE